MNTGLSHGFGDPLIGWHRTPGGILHVTRPRSEPLAHTPVAGNRRELTAPRDLGFVKDHFTVGGERGRIVEAAVGERGHLAGGELERGDAKAAAVLAGQLAAAQQRLATLQTQLDSQTTSASAAAAGSSAAPPTGGDGGDD